MIIQTTVKISRSRNYSAWGVPFTSVRSTKNQCHMEAPHLACFEVYRVVSSPTIYMRLQCFPTSTQAISLPLPSPTNYTDKYIPVDIIILMGAGGVWIFKVNPSLSFT